MEVRHAHDNVFRVSSFVGFPRDETVTGCHEM